MLILKGARLIDAIKRLISTYFICDILTIGVIVISPVLLWAIELLKLALGSIYIIKYLLLLSS